MRVPAVPLAVVAAFIPVMSAPLTPATAQAAPLAQPSASSIAKALQRLSVLGSVLYVAAHPDDENTSLLTYLASGRMVRAAYLSMTRGDGGQNLIGSEQGVALGVIRTQELLAARRIDGAEQIFTRARDFGYSKSVDETLKLWGEDEVLADVVQAIRRFRPDVIVTRFGASADGGHGHHTASAQLAAKAFRAAADPRYQPAGKPALPPWQARRLLWNRGGGNAGGGLRLDIGAYDPLLGLSYGEIAADSRSMHKSQGFGSQRRRGPLVESFEHLAEAGGDRPASGDPFAGIDWSWRRIPGSERAAKLSEDAARAFRPENPAAILPTLAALDAALDGLGDVTWRTRKKQEVAALVAACTGLFIEGNAAAAAVVPGQSVGITVTALNRSNAALKLHELRFVGPAVAGGPAITLAVGKNLGHHDPQRFEQAVAVPATVAPTTPYWLVEAPLPGRFVASDAALAAGPENPPALAVEAHIEIAGRRFVLAVPVRHKWTDPVAGERVRPLEVVPPVSVAPQTSVLLFPDAKARAVAVRVKAGGANTTGKLRLEAANGYVIKPAEAAFQLAAPGDEAELVFDVQAPRGGKASPTQLRVLAQVGDKTVPGQRVDYIEQPHIPIQMMTTPAEVRLVPLELRREGRRIGYIAGAGDAVAESLARVGYEVVVLDEAALKAAPLDGFDAIVTGVRAFNTNDRLGHHHARLMDYVHKGGTMVVQYNTSNRLSKVSDRIGPLPFTIGRDRVTDETAAVKLEPPGHGVFNFPNRLGPADFAGWVQERGLYFASTWDKGYDAPLAMADPGEEPQRGSLLVARHGRGAFIYTGLAFFRQLPAGVAGAYRLFANLVAHGRAPRR